jgi:hypothetical protein
MKTACITLSTPTPEMFAYVSIEVPESIGDVSFFLSGEEIPAIEGTKLYLNDTIISREDRAVLAKFDDSGFSVLGQI